MALPAGMPRATSSSLVSRCRKYLRPLPSRGWSGCLGQASWRPVGRRLGESDTNESFKPRDPARAGLLPSRIGIRWLCRKCKARHLAPPHHLPAHICCCFAASVRFCAGLIETVEPSSCPAAMTSGYLCLCSCAVVFAVLKGDSGLPL